MLNRIAIMGAGSLGTILGAFIAQNRQVDLIDANKAHVDALNANGAKVIGGAELTVPVHALTPDEMEGTYDLFIYIRVGLEDNVVYGYDKNGEKTMATNQMLVARAVEAVRTFGKEPATPAEAREILGSKPLGR